MSTSNGRGQVSMERNIFAEEHEMFRSGIRKFLAKEVVPNFLEWERNGIVPREMFQKAADNGFLAMAVPEEYGGIGIDDFRFSQILGEECHRIGAQSFIMGLNIQNDVALPYFLRYANDEQKRRWLPGIASGELITAIVMSEPGTGSDLAAIATTARREGDHYVVNGAKTFITNGINADLAVTAVKTDPTQRHKGISMLVIERGMPGFERGRKLEKLGLHGQDTAELFFNEVRVPVANLLGEEGKGFGYMVANLPCERLSIAVGAHAAARAALEWTLEYVKTRRAFGQTIASFQATRHALADLRTEIEIGQIFLDRCVLALNEESLTAEQAAMAKLWCTELQGRAVDRCVQLHGGYGFMTEYPITRAYADARVTRIFGGANEIMREIIGRADDL
ncbi:acyl-CoA dehydrogenase family protein [Dechloromonas agitata]|uniref:acyl-CoA dehydrogenase family protein n=1 Tax=Dechloromonas agitata TaxID=73030 RepID=UPI00237E2FB5|nr:acyl-CoA dehydrogenase family protein [Dechloromonas agitata]MDE1544064.1 acyl-CoA dehydrogenase family protein [Dechloromonas agitata]